MATQTISTQKFRVHLRAAVTSVKHPFGLVPSSASAAFVTDSLRPTTSSTPTFTVSSMSDAAVCIVWVGFTAGDECDADVTVNIGDSTLTADSVELGGAALTPGTGATESAGGKLQMGWNKFTIPYTSLTAAAHSQAITLGTLPADARVRGALVLNTAFVLGAEVDFTLAIGITGDPDKLIEEFDLLTAHATTARIGLADADLGVGLIRASAIQGGFMNGAAVAALATFVAASTNVNTASAGSCTVYLLVDVLP